jgi:hypothetical protein
MWSGHLPIPGSLDPMMYWRGVLEARVECRVMMWLVMREMLRIMTSWALRDE